MKVQIKIAVIYEAFSKYGPKSHHTQAFHQLWKHVWKHKSSPVHYIGSVHVASGWQSASLTAKNWPKIGKRGKFRKIWKRGKSGRGEKIRKKRKKQEEKAKLGKVLSLCPSWQRGLATLLHYMELELLPPCSCVQKTTFCRGLNLRLAKIPLAFLDAGCLELQSVQFQISSDMILRLLSMHAGYSILRTHVYVQQGRCLYSNFDSVSSKICVNMSIQ